MESKVAQLLHWFILRGLKIFRVGITEHIQASIIAGTTAYSTSAKSIGTLSSDLSVSCEASISGHSMSSPGRPTSGGSKDYLASRDESFASSERFACDSITMVMRLDLSENLKCVLSSTNLIKNLFNRLREEACRMRRWQSSAMIPRLTAAGVPKAERSSRSQAGYFPALAKRPFSTIVSLTGT